MQHSFSHAMRALVALVLFAMIVGAGYRLDYYRVFYGPGKVEVKLAPVNLRGPFPEGWSVQSAFALRAPEGRLAGLSGLMLDEDRLLVVSDGFHGARFDPPVAGLSALRMRVSKLAYWSDSEAIDLFEGKYWVAYERRHRLVALDRSLQRMVTEIDLELDAPGNRGIEALAALDDGLVALGETGAAFIIRGETAVAIESDPLPAMPVGAAALGGNRFLLLSRNVGLGFTAGLSLVRLEEERLVLEKSEPLRLGFLDNAEGIAQRERADGGRDVWIVTDDNNGPPQRSLLIHFEVEPGGWPDAG